MDIGATPARELDVRMFAAIKEAAVNAHVLVHEYGPGFAIRRRNQSQLAALVSVFETFLFVARRNVGDVRLDPYLQEMQPVGLRPIEFAVTHAAARAHALHVAWADGRARAHGILVRKLALQHVTDDLHIAVPMGSE